MNVYNLDDNAEPEGQWLKLQVSDGLQIVMPPQERASFFKAHPRIAVERHREYSPRGSTARLADMTRLSGIHLPVLSERARSVFEPHLQGLGQWVALDFEEAPYWLFYLDNVQDVLDAPRSDIRYFTSSGKVMSIRSAAFRTEALKGLFMWQVMELPSQWVCVSDSALDLVRQYRLTGFEFELLWSSKHGPLPQGLKNWERPRFTGLETERFDADAFWSKYNNRQQPSPTR